MNLGVTKNLGNFESLRVDVGIERDCDEFSAARANLYKDTMKLLEATITRAEKEVTGE